MTYTRPEMFEHHRGRHKQFMDLKIGVKKTGEITAVDLGAPGWDPFYGHGRVDPLAALRVHSIPSAPVLAPIRNPEGGGTYLVDWNDVPNASTYVLQRSTTDFFANPAVVYSGTASEFHVVARHFSCHKADSTRS